jgi:putative tricarboxylic transport membrane protein
MGHNLLDGLTSLGNPATILYLFGGALLGMVVGVIPGLTTATILSILLAFSYHINLDGTLCLFLGAYAGSYYSASISAILINTPPHPEAFAVTFDGYPMARRGEGARALGISACSTCVGGFIGCAVLVVSIPLMDHMAKVFHPPEYAALVLLALLLVGSLGTDSVAKAVTAVGAGLLLASVGPSLITAQGRYTFGLYGLVDGVSLVAVALGVFAIPQMVMVFGTGTAAAREDMMGREVAFEDIDPSAFRGGRRQLLGGALETFKHSWTVLQSGLVGGITGMIPGIGGFTGNFLAYGVARQASRRRREFGTGIPEGIIAPEGSSLAKEAGHMVPLLALGIPSGVGGALLLAALTIKNIKPGYGFATTFPVVPYQMAWIIALSGLIGTLAGVAVGPQLAKVTRVPGPLIVPFIFVLAVVSPFLVEGQFFSTVEVLVFGAIGFVLRRAGYPLGAFVIGLVLGPTFETNVYLTHAIYPGLSFLKARPIADVIAFVAIAVLIARAWELRQDAKARKRLTEQGDDPPDPTWSSQRSVLPGVARAADHPVISAAVSVALVAVSIFAIVHGTRNYLEATWLMPVIGGFLIVVSRGIALPRELQQVVRGLRRSLTLRTSHETPRSFVQSVATAASPVAVVSGFHVSGRLGFEPRARGPGSRETTTGAGLRRGREIRIKSWGWNGEYTREACAFLLLLLLIVLCWLFGFVWGSSVFVAIYGLAATHASIPRFRRRLVFSAWSTGAVWVTTHEMFNLIGVPFTGHLLG